MSSLSAATRIVLALCCTVIFSLLQDSRILGLALCLAIVFVWRMQCWHKRSWRQLGTANIFVLFLWLTIPLTQSGISLWQYGFINITQEGIALSVSLTLRCNALLVIFLGLLATLPLAQLAAGLERLRCPEKFVFLFVCTCHCLSLLEQEWQRLQTAAALRGFQATTSLHTYRTYANMLGLTLLNSLDRGQRLYEAMLLRAFQGRFRTLAQDNGLNNPLLLGLVIVVLVLLFLADLFVR